MKYREQIESYLLKLTESNITGNVNKHMTHIEDLVILAGAQGIEHALETFNSLFEELKGETPKSQRRVSVKIDGAPAVFVWTDFPGLPGPGLGTKGLFAKTPKAAHSHELIDTYFSHAPDLANKMHALFDHISELGIPAGEIWQGDFLYDSDSLMTQEIDGSSYILFHPNTIVYAVPEDSEIGQRIRQTDVGVVWHTVYTGESLENVTPSFSARAESLNHVPGVFSTDPYVKSIAGTVTLTQEESTEIERKLEEAEALSNQLISHPQYDSIIEDENFINSFFTVFQNATIKAGQKTPDPDTFIDEFYSWAVIRVTSQAEKKIEKLKTEKGQNAARAKLEADLQTIEEIIRGNADTLTQIIRLIKLMTEIKEVFTRKMDALGRFQAYLKMKSGEFRTTGQEGFAISDISGNVVKFIDRTEFSYANFSADVAKGWESDRRVQESVSNIRRIVERMTRQELEQAIKATLDSSDIPDEYLLRALNTLRISKSSESDTTQRLLDSAFQPGLQKAVKDPLQQLSLEFDPNEWDKLMIFLSEHGLVSLPTPNRAVNLFEEVRSSAATLSQQIGVEADEIIRFVERMDEVFFKLNPPQGGIAVGAGEILFAMLMEQGSKRGVGDLEVAGEHIEVKATPPGKPSARLKGDSSQGGIDTLATYRKRLLDITIEYAREGAGEQADDVEKKLRQLNSDNTAFNIYPDNLPIVNAALPYIPEERLPKYAEEFVSRMASAWSGSRHSRAQLYVTQMTDALAEKSFTGFWKAFMAFNFAAYQEDAKWDALMLLTYDSDCLVIRDPEGFAEAATSEPPLVGVRPFNFPQSPEGYQGLVVGIHTSQTHKTRQASLATSQKKQAAAMASYQRALTQFEKQLSRWETESAKRQANPTRYRTKLKPRPTPPSKADFGLDEKISQYVAQGYSDSQIIQLLRESD